MPTFLSYSLHPISERTGKSSHDIQGPSSQVGFVLSSPLEQTHILLKINCISSSINNRYMKYIGFQRVYFKSARWTAEERLRKQHASLCNLPAALVCGDECSFLPSCLNICLRSSAHLPRVNTLPRRSVGLFCGAAQYTPHLRGLLHSIEA